MLIEDQRKLPVFGALNSQCSGGQLRASSTARPKDGGAAVPDGH